MCIARDSVWLTQTDMVLQTLRNLTRLHIDRENAMKHNTTGNKGTPTTKTNKPATKGGSILKVKSKVKSGGNINSLGKH